MQYSMKDSYYAIKWTW